MTLFLLLLYQNSSYIIQEMIQDIYPHKLKNQYKSKARPVPEDYVINTLNGYILTNKRKLETNIISFPQVRDFPEMVYMTRLIYLFSVDETRYFLLNELLEDHMLPDGFEYAEERCFRKVGLGPGERVFAAITAKHLSDWYRDNRFCGRCGKPMVHSATERAMHCEHCEYTSYPRIMPAVIVGVINGDRILITRYKRGYSHNALIAGFTEIGETVEETVAREVMEEAGIKVKNIRYYKSQPWGSANDILLGFYCDVDGDDTITMDSEELKYAEWVKAEDIELQPGSFSLTNEMMKLFKER